MASWFCVGLNDLGGSEISKEGLGPSYFYVVSFPS